MFDRIAGFYDVMNSVMTAGLHHEWRARAVELAEVGPGDRALDVATGTGDLAIALAARGATAGSPNEVDLKVAKQYEPGKLVVAQSGCLACHKIGENGNGGPGPNLSDIADKLPKAAILRTLDNPTAPMPSFRNLPQDKKTALVDFLSQLHGK